MAETTKAAWIVRLLFTFAFGTIIAGMWVFYWPESDMEWWGNYLFTGLFLVLGKMAWVLTKETSNG